MNEEIRKPLTIKIKHSSVKKARIRAVSSGKTFGEWIGYAIEERIDREENHLK